MTIEFEKIQGLDWLAQLNRNFETLSTADLIELASEAETIAGIEDEKGVTPAGLQAKVASDTAKGIVELATSAESITGSDTERAVTPKGLADTLAAAEKRGVHTVTAGEATAHTLSIATGLTSATAFLVQIWRSGVDVHADAIVSLVSGALTIADGVATYDVTEGDKVTWQVF